MDFGALMYFLDEDKVSPLDRLFTQAIGKVKLYGQHTKTTIELYNKEESDIRGQIKEDYDKAMAIAGKEYDKIIAQQGDSESAHQFACHDSGIDAIQANYQGEDASAWERFVEIRDYFYASSLAQGYALLESQLRHLCVLLEKEMGKALTLEHLKQRDYLQSIWIYLTLVAEIDMSSLEAYRTRFAETQVLRNKIMHNGGEFGSGDIPQEISDLVAKYPDLLSLMHRDGQALLKIRQEYLIALYHDLRSFFRELLWIVDQKLGFRLLSERLAYLFGFIAKDITVEGIKAKDIKKGRQVTFGLHSSKDGLELGVKLSMEAARTKSISVVDQIEKNPLVARLKEHLEKVTSLLPGRILGSYLDKDGEQTKTTLILYEKPKY